MSCSDVKDALPARRGRLSKKGLIVTPMFDQSIFVRASVRGRGEGSGHRRRSHRLDDPAVPGLVAKHAHRHDLDSALHFGVDHHSLDASGETLNVMTLGGMALAVGILVDDATVEIENIHRNLHQRKRLVQAILDGASQIAVPAFVSTLCICIVFVPVVFISGAAKFLFTPLAMAVVFAMLTSYLLSRTLVPTMVHYLLAGEVERYGGQLDKDDPHAAAAIYAKEHHGELPPEAQHAEARSILHSGWFRVWRSRSLSIAAARLRLCNPAHRRGWAIEHWQFLTTIAARSRRHCRHHHHYRAFRPGLANARRI